MERDIRNLFDAYATDGVLDSRSFGRCVRRLGITNPLLISRFFCEFDQSEVHFVNQDEFVRGCRFMCNADTDEKDLFVFNLLDKDRNGYVTIEEFTEFCDMFFETARDSCDRCPEKLNLGYAPTIFDSLCELLPQAACDERPGPSAHCCSTRTSSRRRLSCGITSGPPRRRPGFGPPR